MARVRIINDPKVTFALPPTTTTHGFGSLLGPGQNPVSGRQDRDLQRFHGRKGPSGTQESLPTSHGMGTIGKYGGPDF